MDLDFLDASVVLKWEGEDVDCAWGAWVRHTSEEDAPTEQQPEACILETSFVS